MRATSKPTPVLCGSTLQAVAEVLPGSRYRVVIAEEPVPDPRRGARAPYCFALFDAEAVGQAECLAAVERACRYANVTSIVVSNDPDPKRIVAFMRSGAADYIVRDGEGEYLRDLEARLEELASAGPPNTPRAVAARFGQLAHAVYHDAKNPVNNILGFAELLIDIPGTKLSDEQAHFLLRVRSNGNKVLEILEDFVKTADRLAGRS